MVKKPRHPRPSAPFDPFAELDRIQKDWWILDEQNNPKAVNVRTWSEWYEAAAKKGQVEGGGYNPNADPRRVASTETATLWVSTVFLGVNHNFLGKGPPILFETMVFSLETYAREFEGKIRFSPDDFETRRYSTWDDADTGHKATVRRIQKAEADALARVKSIKEGKEHNGR